MRQWLLDISYLAETALPYAVLLLITMAFVWGRWKLGRNDIAEVAKLILIYAVHLLVSMTLVWGTWFYFGIVDGSWYAIDSLNFYAFALAAASMIAAHAAWGAMTELGIRQTSN